MDDDIFLAGIVATVLPLLFERVLLRPWPPLSTSFSGVITGPRLSLKPVLRFNLTSGALVWSAASCPKEVSPISSS